MIPNQKLLTICGVTGHYWPLNLISNVNTPEQKEFQAGYYWDNPAKPMGLWQFQGHGYRHEDDAKPGRVYIINNDQPISQLSIVGQWRESLGNNNVLYCVNSNEITKPKAAELIIFTVECGVTNPFILRSLSRLIDNWGIDRIVDINPCKEHTHVDVGTMHLFIQPDGRICS